jgi:glycosyltransferase involved in cell wall biosynthesis
VPRATLLAVNPSHGHPEETRFWEHLAGAAASRGWQLVQVAARSIPDVPHAVTVRLPARLWQFAGKTRKRPADELTRLPEWMSEDLVELHADWEHRRWDLGRFDPAVIDGVHRLAWYTEQVVGALDPAVVLTTNKIDHPCHFFRLAARHRDIPTALVERSPFDSIWVEPDGLFAESRIWEDYPGTVAAVPASLGAQIVESVRANPAGFRGSEASASRPDVGHDRPLVFLPLDNLLWTGWAQPTHPQCAVDNPCAATPQAGVDAVAAWAARRGGSVLVKAHPACLETRRIDLPTNARLVDGDLAHLIETADLVATFNTKVAFVAAAVGAPLAVLADNPIAAAPSVPYWRREGSIEAALDAALDRGPASSADVEHLFAWLASEYFYTIDAGDRGPLRLVEDIAARVPEAAGPHVTQDELERQVRESPVGPERGERPRLLLDVSRLTNHSGRHSGIARYCRELVARVDDGSFETWAVVREQPSQWPRPAADLFFDLRRWFSGRVISLPVGDQGESIEARLGELGPEDVYHSTHLPLIDRRFLGTAHRVLTVHDVLHLKRPDLYDGPEPPTIQRVLDSLVEAGDSVICVSEQTRRDLLSLVEISADRATTIALAASSVEDADAASTDAPFLLVMGQAEPRKNMANTLDGIALALMRVETGHRVRLVVTSRGLHDAMAAVRASELDDRAVDLVVEPGDDELSSLYAGADLFVFGSVYEGFGLPPLEAAAAGTPSVVVRGSSVSEVMGDAAIYAFDGSVESIASAVGIALTYPAVRRRVGERARARAGRFDWDATAAQHRALYTSLSTTGNLPT